MASLDINIDPYRVISISDLNLKSRSITGCSWSRKETTTWLLAHVGGCFSGRNSLRESYDGAKLVQWLLRVTYTLAWRKRGISKMLRAGLNANGGHVVFFFFFVKRGVSRGDVQLFFPDTMLMYNSITCNTWGMTKEVRTAAACSSLAFSFCTASFFLFRVDNWFSPGVCVINTLFLTQIRLHGNLLLA